MPNPEAGVSEFVDKSLKTVSRRAEAARCLFALIDGHNTSKDIAQALAETGRYPNTNTAGVTMIHVVNDLNELALAAYGHPLITKSRLRGGFSLHPGAADEGVAIKERLLPIAGEIDPRTMMDEASIERFELVHDDRTTYFYDTIYPEVDVCLKRSRGNDDESPIVPGLSGTNLFKIAAALKEETESKSIEITFSKISSCMDGMTDKEFKDLNDQMSAWYGCELYDIPRVGVRTFLRSTLDHINATSVELFAINETPYLVREAKAGFLEISDYVNQYITGRSHTMPLPGELGLLTSLSVFAAVEKLQARVTLDPQTAGRARYLTTHYSEFLRAWGIYTPDQAAINRAGMSTVVGEVVPFKDGNCKGITPDWFFPERGESTRESKEVCKGCKRKEECLEFALEAKEKHGIWGGMSERERRRLRRQRAVAKKAADIVAVVVDDPVSAEFETEELEEAV